MTKKNPRMEILRYLPSKDWPVGSIIIDKRTIYVKGEGAEYLTSSHILSRTYMSSSDDLNGPHVYDESYWSFDYVPYEFFN